MKTSTKLLIAGIVLLIIGMLTRLSITLLFAVPCIGAGFILIIVQGIVEIISRANGVSKPDYRDEARRACGASGSKQRKETKPPWEE